jgi:hypothetical protein
MLPQASDHPIFMVASPSDGPGLQQPLVASVDFDA